MNRRPNLPLSLLAALVLGPLSLSACSGGAEASSAADPEAALAEVQEQTDVPEECREAFPVAVGRADAAAITLMPSDWPADAVAATLCQTSSSGSGIQVASYA